MKNGQYIYSLLSHTRRQGNSIAHALSKRVGIFFHLLVLMEHVPLNIYLIVIFYSSAS